jgi:hypothetical protein
VGGGAVRHQGATVALRHHQGAQLCGSHRALSRDWVARFARTSLFSGANNFEDLTSDPLLSAALGFSEAEIRATFGPELVRLGRDGMNRKTADDALHELAFWYNGYCFDKKGMAPCFNPYPVLVALQRAS